MIEQNVTLHLEYQMLYSSLLHLHTYLFFKKIFGKIPNQWLSGWKFQKEAVTKYSNSHYVYNYNPLIFYKVDKSKNQKLTYVLSFYMWKESVGGQIQGCTFSVWFIRQNYISFVKPQCFHSLI